MKYAYLRNYSYGGDNIIFIIFRDKLPEYNGSFIVFIVIIVDNNRQNILHARDWKIVFDKKDACSRLKAK